MTWIHAYTLYLLLNVVVAVEKCVTFNGRARCYWLVLNEQYNPSVQKCEEQGGHMLILENIEEWRKIVALMSFTKYSWLGINDAAQEGTFLTIFGETPDYLPTLTEAKRNHQDCYIIKYDETQIATRSCTSYCCLDNIETVCRRFIEVLHIIMEANFEEYSAANVTKMFDGDVGTCEDLQNYWTYLPMTTVRTEKYGSGNFSVAVKVSEAIQALAQQTTTVFVSHANLTSSNYYKEQEVFQVCPQSEALLFSCNCPSTCNVYVRFRFEDMQHVGNTVYTLCDIEII